MRNKIIIVTLLVIMSGSAFLGWSYYSYASLSPVDKCLTMKANFGDKTERDLFESHFEIYKALCEMQVATGEWK